jgi:hypothetical protein
MQWFPIVGSILVTLIFILIGIYAFRNRRNNGYHSGGFVSDYPGIRPGEITVQLHSEDRASPHLRSIIERIKTMRTRSTYHRDTRAVLEVLDLMQRPAVREAVMPELHTRYGYSPDSEKMEPYIGPLPYESEITSDGNGRYSCKGPPVTRELQQLFGWYLGDVINGLVTLPSGILVSTESGQHFFRLDDERFDVEPPVMTEVTSDQASRFFASEGEPMATPPPPNIGGLDHPPYAGPNYADEHEIADEMKGIRHYGTEPSDD